MAGEIEERGEINDVDVVRIVDNNDLVSLQFVKGTTERLLPCREIVCEVVAAQRNAKIDGIDSFRDAVRKNIKLQAAKDQQKARDALYHPAVAQQGKPFPGGIQFVQGAGKHEPFAVWRLSQYFQKGHLIYSHDDGLAKRLDPVARACVGRPAIHVGRSE